MCLLTQLKKKKRPVEVQLKRVGGESGRMDGCRSGWRAVGREEGGKHFVDAKRATLYRAIKDGKSGRKLRSQL